MLLLLGRASRRKAAEGLRPHRSLSRLSSTSPSAAGEGAVSLGMTWRREPAGALLRTSYPEVVATLPSVDLTLRMARSRIR